MTACPVPPSAMVEAVVKAMRELQINGTDHALGLMAGDFIAAVLDNLPRHEMIMAVQGYRDQGVISVYFAEQLVELAISAAREAGLGK